VLEEAIFEYDQAILLDPRNATVYSNRNLVFHNLGKYQRAVDEYDETIRSNPEYALA